MSELSWLYCIYFHLNGFQSSLQLLYFSCLLQVFRQWSAARSKRAGTSYYFSCGPNTFSHCDEETGAAYLRAVTENSTKSPFFMCGQEPNYPIWFRAIQDSVNIPEVALFINSRGFNSSIILLHEKFLQFDWLRAVVFQLNLKYLHVKITKPLRVVV